MLGGRAGHAAAVDDRLVLHGASTGGRGANPCPPPLTCLHRAGPPSGSRCLRPSACRAWRWAWPCRWPWPSRRCGCARGLSLGCGFRALTGLPCLLCGGTRACGALVQGDWAAAWASNPGAVVLLLWLGLCAAQAVLEGAAGWRRVQPWPWWQPWALRAVGGGLLLSWAARLAGWV
ncbi:MAG: DUF2752 domain-containing protein [Burkholderiaceae bacterium]